MKVNELTAFLQRFPQTAEVKIKLVNNRVVPLDSVEMSVPAKPIKMTPQNLAWGEMVSDVIEAHLLAGIEVETKP